jgi:predicted NBD/HSP70 family sugar kinase
VTIPSLTRNAGTATLEEAFERAAAGDARAGAAVAAAAFALGVAIAEVANIADPEKVVVTGEGLAIAREARSALDAGLAARLDPVAEPVVVDINDFDFADYAWAAAISAIRLVV